MFNVQGQMVAMGGYVKPSIRLKAEMLTERPSAPIKEGKWSFFNNKGQLASVVHYKAGVKHGAEETFSSSGGLLSTGMYVDGLKNGAWKRFTSSGILEELLTFKDGDLHGPVKASTGRGKPVSEGAYHNGEQDGTWMFYLEDGRVHEISVFEEGDLVNNVRVNGPFTDWHNQDRPASEVHYRNKLKDGPFTEWHNQGGSSLKNRSTRTWGNCSTQGHEGPANQPRRRIRARPTRRCCVSLRHVRSPHPNRTLQHGGCW